MEEMEGNFSVLRPCLQVGWWILCVATILPVTSLALLYLAFWAGVAVESVILVTYDWQMEDWRLAVPVPTGCRVSVGVELRGRRTEVMIQVAV